jgi:hypothetical protein
MNEKPNAAPVAIPARAAAEELRVLQGVVGKLENMVIAQGHLLQSVLEAIRAKQETAALGEAPCVIWTRVSTVDGFALNVTIRAADYNAAAARMDDAIKTLSANGALPIMDGRDSIPATSQPPKPPNHEQAETVHNVPANLPSVCPNCEGELWDNSAQPFSPDTGKRRPILKCKSCDWRMWTAPKESKP